MSLPPFKARSAVGLAVACMGWAGAAHGQPLTRPAPTLSEHGAAAVVEAARQAALRAHASAAIAVVDPEGLLLAFIRMDDVRPGSVELAIGKARAAALMQRPTAELEENVAQGRVGLATAGLTALRGGAPLVVDGDYVGAVGIAGRVKEQDAQIAAEVAAGVSAPGRP
jgi:glc operon protein GlcG